MSERRRRRLWWLAGILSALLVAVAIVLALTAGGGGGRSAERSVAPPPSGPAPAGPPAPPAPAGLALGANVNRVFEDPRFAPAVDQQLSALRASGANVARTDALWEVSEPSPPLGGVHRYDWAFDDRIAAALARHGLRWLPVLDYTAGWAQSVAGQDHSPPASAADYAAYAGAFAARYGPRGSFWAAHPALTADPVDTIEVWNEPDNVAFWFPRPNAAAYAQLYLATRDAVTAARPGIRVIVGGLQHPESFMAALVRARPDLVGHVDGVAVHPYARTPAQVLGRVRSDRAALVRLGLGGVPLYVTELGWTTSPPSAHQYLPAAERPGALFFTLAGLGHLACGVSMITVYTWVTAEQDRGDGEEWYGLYHPGGGPSADVRAFAGGVRAAVARGAALPC